MLSTFSGIEVGKKGLMANNAGIDTVGHNLSNMATEGYSRQNVNLSAFVPIYDPGANRMETAGQIGTGVIVQDIQRVRDQAVDDRINFEQGGLGFWKMKKQFLSQVETIYNDPNSPNLRTVIDEYWESWQKVSADPTETASRAELVERAQNLTDTVNHMHRSLTDLRQNADMLVGQRINEVNNIAEEIASLNLQIVKSEAVGDNPNDLYDKRDLLIDRLSKILDIRVERNNNHEVIVFIGAENLVQGGKFHTLQGIGNAQNDGYLDVYWDDGRLVKLGAGELAGLVSARDDDLRTAVGNLDSIAQNIVSSTNELHRDGFGLNLSTNNNFFREMPLSPYANGNWDFTNDGVADGTAIFRVAGTENLQPTTTIGTAGQLNFGPSARNGAPIVINYQATDTVNDVITRINQSDAGVSAYLNDKGQLTLKARFPNDRAFPEFVIRHIEDSGNLLVGIAGMLNQSGAAGAFDYQAVDQINQFASPQANIELSPNRHPGNWMALDQAILNNTDNIAAAGAIDTTGDGDPNLINGIGDNRNAIAIAQLRYKPIMVESESTVGDYFQTMVGEMGTRSETAQVHVDKTTTVVESLTNLRQEISGVNVDQELSKMIMFQHGYNASARLVTTIDKMLDTLIRMGA